MSEVIEDVQEEVDIDIEEPSLYGVVFHNDNTTPVDFVISLISTVFNKPIKEAEELTYQVHNNGSAVVAIYDYDIAEQKKLECDAISKSYGLTLQVTVEEQ